MPAAYILHEVNTLTFGSVRNNKGWFAFRLSCFFKSAEYLFHIMTIDLNYMPPEGAVFIGQRINAHNIINTAVYLQAILINDAAEVV
ncbi:hypothetical protein ES708_30504 [subsurface metagenome]